MVCFIREIQVSFSELRKLGMGLLWGAMGFIIEVCGGRTLMTDITEVRVYKYPSRGDSNWSITPAFGTVSRF